MGKSLQKADVALIGAGPIGLEMAVALKRSGIDYLHFDARQIGYTISWFAPGTRFFSSNERIAIAGVPLQSPDQNKSTREQYLAYLRGIVQEFDLQVRTYEPVIGIKRARRRGSDESGYRLTTRPRDGEREYLARRLILATGGTDHPRRLNIPGEDLPHVSHYFHDPHIYFGRRTLIVGGRNSAVEAALRCHHAGARAALSYRRDQLEAKSIKYWLLPEFNSLIEAGRIEGHFNTAPVKITRTHVELMDAKQNADPRLAAAATRRSRTPANRTIHTRSVEADFVLLLTGYEADQKLLKLAGVQVSGPCRTPEFDIQTMETNVPGVYVAGTAVAGTQEKYTVFIENCHVHVQRILASLTGTAAPAAEGPVGGPES